MMNVRAAWSALWSTPERRDLSWDLLRAGHAGWGVADASGQVVTHRSAEHGLATVLGCVQGIASSIASLPAYVYRWDGKRRVLAETHPLQRLIDRGPNRHQSWSDWLGWVLAGCLLRGNSVSRNRGRRPLAPWSSCAPSNGTASASRACQGTCSATT